MTAVGTQQPRDTATQYGALQFVIESTLKRMQTCMPVKVVAVSNDGGVTPVGTVNVVPLVNQVTGDGQAVPHAVIFNIPYFRLQGGANAIILDPQVDDIGLCVFASRDISAVKADPAAAVANGGANPGSARTYNFADGIYIGGILNGTPTQFVRFTADGLYIVSPELVRVEAPVVEIQASERATIQAPVIELIGQVEHSGGDIDSEGDVLADGVSLHNHVHGGVQSGGNSTDPPT